MTSTQDFVVAFTDPFWAISDDGHVSEDLATIEREVLGPRVALRLGTWKGDAFDTSADSLIGLTRGADAVVVGKAKFTPDVVKSLEKRCRVVAKQGDGFDNIAFEEVRRQGIFGFNIPDYCVSEAASHTLGMVLAYERGIIAQNQLLKSGEWSTLGDRIPRRLDELSFGLIGCGRVGSTVAARAKVFFGNVHAYDPSVHRDLLSARGIVAHQDLHSLLAVSDYVSLHADLNSTSYRIINEQSLQFARHGVVLVNVCRGELVESAAILGALEEGRVAAYLSDAFDAEPPTDAVSMALLHHPQVYGSCHRGYLSQSSLTSLRRRTVEVLAEVLQTGLPPSYGRLC